ncbi:hypothetical protein HD806DRAFT_543573 [Xylariaceae sp. AK1471]|nr:hypothetical protein HD806DRAFT_543573 [Xylariaceae sp. AK1471]
MAVNLFDYLIDDCEDPASYPAALRHTQLLPHSLRRYEELLNERTPRVFSKDSRDWRLRFWDSYDGQLEFPSSAHDCISAQEVQKYLLCSNQKDPVCRHVFLEANHSRAPLDCSREMLTLLFTFHQVMPQFLDVVLSFGTFPGRNVPTAFHRCIFRYEHFTDPEDAQQYNIPQLGRSGLEFRHCYNLWSVEKSDDGQLPWNIRQAGVYHSFDIDSGRATWIHVKANNVLQKRIKEATTSAKLLQAKYLQTVQGSFTATLMTHLIVFEWCNESWRQYLNHWECEHEAILTKIKNAPIKKVEKALMDVDSNIASIFQPLPRQTSFPPPARSGTINSQGTLWAPSRKNTTTSDQYSLSNLQIGRQRIRSGLTGTTLATIQRAASSMPPITEGSPSENESNPFQIFDEFKFDDLQRLHALGTKLQEADLILKLNADVLTEMMEYYQNYVRDVDTPQTIREGCQAALSKFIQRTTGIIRELQTERTRIATLILLLEDGKALFDAITNFRNMELNRLSSKRMEILTEDMHQSTLQMEKSTLQMETIAGKTEKETASMHIITFVTLIFLPGTFIAVRYALPMRCKVASACLTTYTQTLLGAGFYQWPDSDETSDIPSYPVWRPSFFYLFLKISVLLTAATLLVWLTVRLRRWISWERIRRIGGRRTQGDEEAQLQVLESANNA